MAVGLPKTMTCIEIPEPGDYNALKPGTRPVPSPGDNEILIKVAAAGVNHPDLMQRRGVYPPPPGAPDIPGLEVAGTVAAIGAKVDAWNVGDDVTALVAGGGYAEYCVAPSVQALPVPKGLTMIEAAALPETFFTVWINLFERARLEPGESALVHGGASGIGTAAIMIAAALGSTVYATAGSQEKCAACEKLGAVRAINYKTEDFVSITKEMTGNKGVNVVLDMIGGDYLSRNIDSLAEDGRLAIIALLGGAKAELDIGRVLRKRLTITGSTLRPRTIAFKGSIAQALREKVWPLIEAGKIKPVVQEVLPLTDASESHRLLEAGNHVGNFVLSVS